MSNGPIVFTGNADDYKNDKIFKMLEMDPSDARFIALKEAVSNLKAYYKTEESIEYSTNWYFDNKADKNFNPPNNLDKNAYIAVTTYICTEEGTPIKQGALDELKQMNAGQVLASIKFREGDANLGRNMSICCLPVLSPPDPDNICLKHAAVMTCIIENSHDLRIKMSDHYNDMGFLPDYKNN